MTSQKNIAIYIDDYLTPSMTFIYRQIIELNKSFNTIVLTSDEIKNTDLFPFDSIYSCKKKKITKLFSNLEHRYLNNFLPINPKLSPNQGKYFKKLLTEKEIDLVHAHFGPSAIEILPVVKALKIPLLVSFHGYDASILLREKKYLYHLEELLNYANFTTPSKYMKGRITELCSKYNQYFLLHYGIPLNFYTFTRRKPISEKVKEGKNLVFLQVSNFVEKKGHEFTIIAFKEFLKFYPDSKLMLAGEGYLRQKIQNMCNEIGISKRVNFLGSVDQNQVKELMEKADVFLHHSITSETGDQEGIPNVIMEAMASGLPVISTKHAGIPELIEHGKNGFLVEEKNVGMYVNCLKDILKIDHKIPQRAYNTIKTEFNLEIQIEKLKKIYFDISG